MNATYGWRRHTAGRTPLPPPYTSYAHPTPPDKVYCDHSPRCIGCPYPRHGLACYGKGNGHCLREDMRALEKKWLAQREEKRMTQVLYFA